MKKIFEILIEVIYWIAIFASPVLLSLFIGIVICINNEKLLWLSICICSIGIIFGIFLAERIRKKYGCARYIARILGGP